MNCYIYSFVREINQDDLITYSLILWHSLVREFNQDDIHIALSCDLPCKRNEVYLDGKSLCHDRLINIRRQFPLQKTRLKVSFVILIHITTIEPKI